MRPSKELVALSIAFACILIIIFGFIGKSIVSRWGDREDTLPTAEQKNDLRKYPILPVEAFRLKLSRNDPVEIIDLRPQPLYDEEHIPNAKHKTTADITDYAPAMANAEVIIITLADDAVSMEQTNTIFRSKNFPYAFLENGMAGWKSQNGNTISIGDPNSVTDRAKVSFKTAPEVKTILEGAEKNLSTIIDVRSASLYETGHIPNAINIPLEALEERRGDIPGGRHTIVYGKNDLESFQAAVRLYDLNIFSPYALENGFTAWIEQKYSTEK